MQRLKDNATRVEHPTARPAHPEPPRPADPANDPDPENDPGPAHDPDAADPRVTPAPAPRTPSGRGGNRAPTRGELVQLAIQLDALIARADEMGLGMTAYLIGVARADLSDRLGERHAAPPPRGPAPD